MRVVPQLKMIDRASRDRLAELLRQLCAGTLTLCEFDRGIDTSICDSHDRAVQSVLETAFEIVDPESLPFALKRFRGRHRLPADTRRQLAIATIFLHSDLEFEWPIDLEYPNYDGAFLILCALLASAGLFCIPFFPWLAVFMFSITVFAFFYARTVASRVHERWVTRQRELGREYDVWPFLTTTEYECQISTPRLLSGA